jgi:prepilin-type N-terminal cleavage/methylation domain-containing protein
MEGGLHQPWATMRRTDGFSLIETLVAVAVLTVAVGALLQIAFKAVEADQQSRVTSLASVVAQQKLEEIRGQALAGDTTGLAVSPPGTLESNAAGFSDTFDGAGRPLPSGATGVYVRRWSIQQVGGHPHVLMAQVIVIRQQIERVRLAGIVFRRATGA